MDNDATDTMPLVLLGPNNVSLCVLEGLAKSFRGFPTGKAILNRLGFDEASLMYCGFFLFEKKKKKKKKKTKLLVKKCI